MHKATSHGYNIMTETENSKGTATGDSEGKVYCSDVSVGQVVEREVHNAKVKGSFPRENAHQ